MRFTFDSNNSAAAALAEMRKDTDDATRRARGFFTSMTREGPVVSCLVQRRECIIPEALAFLKNAVASSRKAKGIPADKLSP